jgi:hypothetical protein
MSTSTSPDVELAIAHALWMQWRSCGVQTGGSPARKLIDPETLLIESAIVADRLDDPRIADAAIAWASQHHDLVITARLKSMLKRYVDSDRVAFLTMSRRIIDIVGRLAWPAVEAASAWSTSVGVQLPRLADRPELLRLRTRALFGANARAEAVAFLTSVGVRGTDLATLERETSFSKRHLAGPLEQLAAEGSVERWWLGNRQQFRLSDPAREFLGYPLASAHQLSPLAGGTGWIDWQVRFHLVRLIGDALTRIGGPGGTVSAVGRIRAAEGLLAQHGLQAPLPLEIDQEPADREGELAAWVAEATVQLLAV